MSVKKTSRVVALLCALVIAVVVAPAIAQAQEVKEKPPMYSYVSFWAIPRAQWGEMQKADAADQPILQKAYASGALVGYGSDVALVHESDGITHDQWWSSMSMAGLMNVLDQFYKSGSATTSVLESATKHFDGIFVTRFYNWRAGSYKDAYSHVGSYKLKDHAPDDALETLSKNALAPFLEKLLADGTIVEYEIDTEAIHTEAPGTFWIVYLCPNAEGLDKANAGLRDHLKANPLMGPAFDSVVDFKPHRDSLQRTNATYK